MELLRAQSEVVRPLIDHLRLLVGGDELDRTLARLGLLDDALAANQEPGDSRPTNQQPGDSRPTNQQPGDSRPTNQQPADVAAANREAGDSERANPEAGSGARTNQKTGAVIGPIRRRETRRGGSTSPRCRLKNQMGSVNTNQFML